MTDRNLRRVWCAATVLLALFLVSCGDFWSNAVASISVSPPSPSMLTGSTLKFTASATYENGDKKVMSSPVWTTSNAEIVYINSSGMATAVATGSAVISASMEGVSGSTTVTVTTSPLMSLEISPVNPSIPLAQATQQFTATGRFSDGSTRDISSGVLWESSDTTVATISQTGLASLLSKGSTTIKATSGDISISTTLTITTINPGT